MTVSVFCLHTRHMIVCKFYIVISIHNFIAFVFIFCRGSTQLKEIAPVSKKLICICCSRAAKHKKRLQNSKIL